jgi:hypothetical protein
MITLQQALEDAILPALPLVLRSTYARCEHRMSHDKCPGRPVPKRHPLVQEQLPRLRRSAAQRCAQVGQQMSGLLSQGARNARAFRDAPLQVALQYQGAL